MLLHTYLGTIQNTRVSHQYLRLHKEIHFTKRCQAFGFTDCFFCLYFDCAVNKSIDFFISRDDKVLSEIYCYHRYNGTIMDGVAVKNKANIKELLTYFPANPLEGTLLIPPNNSFVMDTIRIPAGEEVKVLNYLNDSSIAYISAQNPWYRSDSRISKREIYGYIPIFMLHTSSAND